MKFLNCLFLIASSVFCALLGQMYFLPIILFNEDQTDTLEIPLNKHGFFIFKVVNNGKVPNIIHAAVLARLIYPFKNYLPVDESNLGTGIYGKQGNLRYGSCFNLQEVEKSIRIKSFNIDENVFELEILKDDFTSCNEKDLILLLKNPEIDYAEFDQLLRSDNSNPLNSLTEYHTYNSKYELRYNDIFLLREPRWVEKSTAVARWTYIYEKKIIDLTKEGRIFRIPPENSDFKIERIDYVRPALGFKKNSVRGFLNPLLAYSTYGYLDKNNRPVEKIFESLNTSSFSLLGRRSYGQCVSRIDLKSSPVEV